MTYGADSARILCRASTGPDSLSNICSTITDSVIRQSVEPNTVSQFTGMSAIIRAIFSELFTTDHPHKSQSQTVVSY